MEGLYDAGRVYATEYNKILMKTLQAKNTRVWIVYTDDYLQRLDSLLKLWTVKKILEL